MLHRLNPASITAARECLRNHFATPRVGSFQVDIYSLQCHPFFKNSWSGSMPHFNEDNLFKKIADEVATEQQVKLIGIQETFPCRYIYVK